MLPVLIITAPIFALVFAGWLARRIGVLGPNATSELNRFVVYLALPALLIDTVANAHWAEIWQPGFVGAFALGMMVVFAFVTAIRLRGRPLADATIDGLNAAYANTAFIGIPLVLAVFGAEGLAAPMIATILTVCLLFGAALVLIEIALQTGRRPGRLPATVTSLLLRNPLLVAPVAGGLLIAFGIAIPAPAEMFLKLLGGAASPCALVALGLFLAEDTKGAAVQWSAVAGLAATKLLIHPLATWAAAAWLFRLPPATTQAAVLLAALPTGTGPFMVAEYYRRQAALTSRVVLVTTTVSLATTTLYLVWLA